MSSDDKKSELGHGTTGHSWDGIEEWNNPLPRWWLWTFYVTIIWGVLFTIAYPAWPLISSATGGFLSYSTRANVDAEIAAVAERNAPLNERLVAIDLTTIRDDAELHGYAVNKGAAVFRANCSQCHGAGAAGVQASGYPSLLDDAWLWGGEIDQIAYTIRHGIRNEQDPDAHWSEMPAYGDIFTDEEISQVVHYALSLSDSPEHDPALASAGEQLWFDNCAACHGDEGMGMADLGAPNLTDAIWLYGGSLETVTETVTHSRFGIMPAWGLRLTDAEVAATAAYVHQLGGGQ
ncbi:MAG: cytochrome-c oxidase, cbb3-type subunit III [Rhodobacteraceae bacterium]|nr:cytochrome-c oxidase, cbb3-type subunit III [Paracoccaceae bacterium]